MYLQNQTKLCLCIKKIMRTFVAQLQKEKKYDKRILGKELFVY